MNLYIDLDMDLYNMDLKIGKYYTDNYGRKLQFIGVYTHNNGVKSYEFNWKNPVNKRIPIRYLYSIVTVVNDNAYNENAYDGETDDEFEDFE